MLKLIFNLFFIILNFVFLLADTNKESYQFLTLVILIFIIVSSNYKSEKQGLSIYNLFIFTNIFFVFSRILLDLFGYGDFTIGNKWIYYEYTKDQIKEILFFLNSVILFINLGFSFDTIKVKKSGIKEYKLIEKIGTLLFVSSVPGLVLKLIFQLKAIIQHGYIYRYTEAFQNMYIPPYLKGWGVLFDLGFYMLVFSRPPKKKFNTLSIIYIFIQLLISQGSRGQMVIPIICIAFYNYSVYKVRMNSKALILGLILCIFTFGFVASLRSGNNFDLKKPQILGVLWSQGVTLPGTIGYSVIYKDEFSNENIYYFLKPLFSKKIVGAGYSEAISRFISEDKVIEGEGLGGSFYGELYEIRYLGAFLLSVLMGVSLKILCTFFDKNNYLITLTMLLLPNILWMARGSLIVDYGTVIRITYTFLIIFCILQMENKIMREKNEKIDNDNK